MKKTKGFGLLGIIIIMIVTAVVSSLATGVIMLNNSSVNINGSLNNLEDDQDLLEFIKVYDTLISKYYDDIDKEGMLNAAEEGMLEFLGDKYTTYLNDSEYQEIIDELSGTYNGIGITIDGNKVVDVTENSPASKAGVEINDIIVTINNVDVSNMNGNEIGNIIKSEDITYVNLEINRNGLLLNFSIKKENLLNPSISYEVLKNTNIGYIYIKNFSQNLNEQVSDALKEMESLGIESLIIDVRDNVGGYLSAAEETASLFLENNKIIYSLESNNSKYTYYDKTKEKRTYKIAVLINKNSASASEILAAALKESYGATLVGAKSYGKGKVQQVVSLTSGDSVKYTSAKWLTPSGNCIDGIGLSPDYNVVYEELEEYDSQLLKAIEVVQ